MVRSNSRQNRRIGQASTNRVMSAPLEIVDPSRRGIASLSDFRNEKSRTGFPVIRAISATSTTVKVERGPRALYLAKEEIGFLGRAP
jgi:hypothetical protein